MKHIKTFDLITEGVEVKTNRYQRAHGRKPRGFGQWAFYFDDMGGEPIFVPKAMSYSDAVKWAKAEAKKAGKREIYVGESLNEARKPKSWDTMFAMNAIKAYQNGEFNLNDKDSILAWDTEYNGGRAPKPAFDTKEIIDYAIKTGKKPDGSKMEESVNEAEFLGLPLETFADWYAAADVALSIGVTATVAFAVLAKLGIAKGKQLFSKGKKAVDAWYAKNGEDVGESVTEAYSDEERMELAKKGLALGDGSFPIKDLKDLKNAIQAYGRAKDQAKAAKFIAKRAKALGAEDLIPDTEDFQKALKESLDHSEVMQILDAAAMFTSDAHVAANQMWWDRKELIDYLLSDHIPKKHHKQFLKYVK